MHEPAASASFGFTVHSSMDMEIVELVKRESSMYISIEDLVVKNDVLGGENRNVPIFLSTARVVGPGLIQKLVQHSKKGKRRRNDCGYTATGLLSSRFKSMLALPWSIQ